MVDPCVIASRQDIDEGPVVDKKWCTVCVSNVAKKNIDKRIKSIFEIIFAQMLKVTDELKNYITTMSCEP